MKHTGKYDKSFRGEFADKAQEREFFNYDMRRYAKFIGPVAIIFGVIYMLFLIPDYFNIANPSTFMLISIIRAVVLVFSVAIHLFIKKVSNYADIAYLITIYEILSIISFIVIIYQYDSITYLSFFSVIVITLAVYVTPNKLINSQIISVLLSVLYFIISGRNMEGMGNSDTLKIISYNIILIIFINIDAYLTNYYKRKQFADVKNY
jgi:hypothetical protein